MALNLHKNGIVLSKDGFSACHPLSQGSMVSSKRSRCSFESVDYSHNGHKITRRNGNSLHRWCRSTRPN